MQAYIIYKTYTLDENFLLQKSTHTVCNMRFSISIIHAEWLPILKAETHFPALKLCTTRYFLIPFGHKGSRFDDSRGIPFGAMPTFFTAFVFEKRCIVLLLSSTMAANGSLAGRKLIFGMTLGMLTNQSLVLFPISQLPTG